MNHKRMGKALQIASFLSSLFIGHVAAYSNGAPAEGCWNGRPLHGNFLPQGGPSIPYKIVANATKYGPGDIVVVSVEGVGGKPLPHKGFMIRILSGDSKRGGRWAVDRRLQRYNSECGVTHKDARSRSKTIVLWRAPRMEKGHIGRIQFRAVVAANFSHFWDNVISHSLVPDYPDRGSNGLMRRYRDMLSILSEPKPNSTSDKMKGQNGTTNTSTNTNTRVLSTPAPTVSTDAQSKDRGVSVRPQSNSKDTARPN